MSAAPNSASIYFVDVSIPRRASPPRPLPIPPTDARASTPKPSVPLIRAPKPRRATASYPTIDTMVSAWPTCKSSPSSWHPVNCKTESPKVEYNNVQTLRPPTPESPMMLDSLAPPPLRKRTIPLPPITPPAQETTFAPSASEFDTYALAMTRHCSGAIEQLQSTFYGLEEYAPYLSTTLACMQNSLGLIHDSLSNQAVHSPLEINTALNELCTLFENACRDADEHEDVGRHQDALGRMADKLENLAKGMTP